VPSLEYIPAAIREKGKVDVRTTGDGRQTPRNGISSVELCSGEPKNHDST